VAIDSFATPEWMPLAKVFKTQSFTKDFLINQKILLTLNSGINGVVK